MQFVGFDVHKKYTFFTQMDTTGQIRRQGKLVNDRDALTAFFAEINEPASVVIEANMSWYHVLPAPK